MRPDQVRFRHVTEPIDPEVHLADARRRREARRARHGVQALVMVAAGGAIGAGARYGAALLWPTAAGSFPWTTLGVNASGCLLIGILMVTLTEATPVWVRPFFGTGVLGGYTTFSTYCVDAERLVTQGRPGLALAYLAVTPAVALAAVTAGALATRRLLAMKTARRTP
jgi:CrcB protein